MPENELDKFLGDVTKQNEEQSLFPTEPAPEEGEKKEDEKKEETPEENAEARKNRRHRRLEEQLEHERQERQRERELRIAAEARAAGRTDTSNETVDARLLRMYGDTPEGREAAKLHMEVLADATKQGREEALTEMRRQKEEDAAAERSYANRISSELETLEDEFDMDLTSNSPAATKARTEYLELLQSVSPKGQDGSITDFADFRSTFELFKRNREQNKSGSTQRAKEIASRTMAPSGSVDVQKTEDEAGLAWLRRNGIKV